MARFALPDNHDAAAMLALREAILASPPAVASHRAAVFTRVWRANEGVPWIVKKALAMREYFRTVPLYVREGDKLAGSISETPGAMPVFVELGIAENNIYTGETPERAGYLRGQVDPEIVAYWEDRNLWGRWRAWQRVVRGREVERTEAAQYKFISNQGHLSPSYREVLAVGLPGVLARVKARRDGEIDPAKLEFLTAAELSLTGLIDWAGRYGAFCAQQSERCNDAARRADFQAMARIADALTRRAPETFREAMQLIWLVHQAIHIEGHGYSNTPDRLDQLLLPFYRADTAAGRLTDDEALTLCETLLLRQRDNSVWGNEHNLTQGLVVGGSAADGTDQTNELSWLFIAATGAMSLPEPLVWVRWHPAIDPDFFDFCLETLAGTTCFPLMMSDTAVPAMFMAAGVTEADAFDYVPCGCNELGIPGKAYFNPAAGVGYLPALEAALTRGRGYAGEKAEDPTLPDPAALATFDDLTDAVATVMRRQIEHSYAEGLSVLRAQMRWGQTPLTSCFFDGCIDRAADMTAGTTYNILSCGGSMFANMIDGLAAIREVVYERRAATLADVAAACRDNFDGHEALRAKLLRAAKHGNDDPRLADLVRRLERMRDEPLKDVCRDPRDGARFVNSHVVRSSHVRAGRVTGATPDGRLAGAPLAPSVAASTGTERRGPTALLNSVLMMDPVTSWQGGYNVNLRLSRTLLTDPAAREKVRRMLAAYFRRGGQEMQINAVDTDILRAAQADPAAHRDLVVRVAGFSAFFVNLDRDIQEEIIARTEHGL
ncbi:MAG: pyruvate formate lyase family protein [Planctomycetota bacterium]